MNGLELVGGQDEGGRHLVGVIWGRNRQRGDKIGAVYTSGEHGLEDGASVVKRVVTEEARLAGVAATQELLTTCAIQILELYEAGFLEWKANRENTVGFVYEFETPSGVCLLVGDPRVLAMASRGVQKVDDDADGTVVQEAAAARMH